MINSCGIDLITFYYISNLDEHFTLAALHYSEAVIDACTARFFRVGSEFLPQLAENRILICLVL